jgi:hypothetical protein
VRYVTGAVCDPSHPDHAGGRAAARIGHLTKVSAPGRDGATRARPTSTDAPSESLTSRQEGDPDGMQIHAIPNRSAPFPAQWSSERSHVRRLSNFPPTGAASKWAVRARSTVATRGIDAVSWRSILRFCSSIIGRQARQGQLEERRGTEASCPSPRRTRGEACQIDFSAGLARMTG